ncbi:MAG: hypothetical protein N2441_04090 [Rhodocyclaceae bacterium]|nr:hypothetical protein [Rhodocyclaceae bacterium]
MRFWSAVSIVAMAASYAFFLDWRLLWLWTMVLVGLVGGKVFLYPSRSERFFYLLALGYLVLSILAWILPMALVPADQADPRITQVAKYAAPFLFLVMAFLRQAEPFRPTPELVDYVYGILVVLLVAVVALGSLTLTLLSQTGYLTALLTTLAATAAVLLILGFFWNPQAGFGGLSSAMAQHMTALNQPLERWIETLAELDRHETDAERFLATAAERLAQCMPGVAGLVWRVDKKHGECGEVGGGRRYLVEHGRLGMELFLQHEPGEALRWDYDLAVRLLADHYEAKQRAQALLQLTYLAAIHESGARLTHDVKNLLQSLETLCHAASREGEIPSPSFHALLRRQLPEITRRLSQTLAKLGAPAEFAPEAPEDARQWWENLSLRYCEEWLVFEPLQNDFCLERPSLFTTVAENLLQNLLRKKRDQAGLHARASLSLDARGPVLRVCDDGQAIRPEIASRLFADPLPSAEGFGIGLFQSAKLAQRHGYRLLLSENRSGAVCFCLCPDSEQSVQSACASKG